MFAFGESEIYYQYKSKEGSLLSWIQKKIHRTLRFVPILFYGWGPLPLRHEINTVVGSPLKLPRIESPTEEEIAQFVFFYFHSTINSLICNQSFYFQLAPKIYRRTEAAF